MNKNALILFLIIPLLSCNKTVKNEEMNILDKPTVEISEKSENFTITNDLDQISKDGLRIWELIIDKKYSTMSKYISNEYGLLISTEGIFNSSLDINISSDSISRINDDDTVHYIYFSTVGEKLPFTNKQVFDQFFSFPLNRITEVKTNDIVTREYIYDEFNVSSILDLFPSESNLVDIFIEPEEEGSMDWYHIFLVIKYINQRPFLHGLGIAYRDF